MLLCTSLLVLMLVWMSDCTGAGAQPSFTVQPVSVIQAEGLEAVFECLHSGAAAYIWFVNGLIKTDPNFPLDASTSGGLRGSPSTLTIPARPEYNNTVVQCRAVVVVGGALQLVLSDSATLTVQGVSVIGIEIEGGNHVLSWVDHPFTTSITYCVDVIKTSRSTGISSLVSSVCGLTQTMFSFSHHDLDRCDKFNFTVTPTDRENNGTSSDPMPWYIRIYNGNVTDTNVAVVGERKQVSISFDVPDCYQPVNSTISVTDDSGSVYTVEPIRLTNSEVILSLPNDDNNIIIDMILMDSDRVEIMFSTINIRTNDINDMTVSDCTQPNCVNISLTFIEGSSSPGALIIVLPTQENGFFDYSSSVYMFLARDISEGNSVITTRGGNKVFAFDVEDDGTLREPVTYAAGTVTVDVTGDELTTNYPIENDNIQAARSMDGVVIVTSSDDSLVYLVIVHSVNSPDKLHVRTINTTARTATITPDGDEDVYVVVLSWEQGQSILSSSVSFVSLLSQFPSPTRNIPVIPQNTQEPGLIITGGVLGVLFVLLLMVIVMLTIIVITVKIRRNAANETQPSGASVGTVDLSRTYMGIEQPNQAYSLVLMDNKSYEKVSHRRKRNQQEAVNRGQAHTVNQFASGDEVPERPHEYEEIQPHENVNTQPHQYEDIQPRCAMPTYVNVHNV